MRKKHWVVVVFLVTFLLVFSNFSQAKSVNRQKPWHFSTFIAQNTNPDESLEDQDLENQLIFGYIPDAPPVSSRGSLGGIGGYCGRLRDYLQDVGNSNGFEVKTEVLDYDQRFQAFEGIVDGFNQESQGVECGPSTKTRDRELSLEQNGGFFSDTFFTTSTKLLIRKDKVTQLTEDPSLIKIGVIGGTSGVNAEEFREQLSSSNLSASALDSVINEFISQVTTTQVISQIYPTARVIDVTDRADAINKLEGGEIDAYASDEVILVGIKNDKQEFPNSDAFTIEPKIYGLTREEYGIVVYNNPQLLSDINNWIDGDGQKALDELRKNSIHSRVSLFFQVLTAKTYFYSFVIAFCGLFLLLLITHPISIYTLFKVAPARFTNKFIDWVETRKRKKGGKDFLVVLSDSLLHNDVFALVAHKANNKIKLGLIDRETAVKMVEELGIQPLLQKYQSENLTEEEIYEKAAEDIAQRAQSDAQIPAMWKTWLDAAGSTAATEAARKVIERAFNQSF
jgi:ABC-type amino acid transport substrate-binding protein